jgi:four helix bundle protein
MKPCEPFDRRQHRRWQGRFTKANRSNIFGISRGSLQECVPLLERARGRAFLTAEECTNLKGSPEEIARMLSGLIKGLDNREV